MSVLAACAIGVSVGIGLPVALRVVALWDSIKRGWVNSRVSLRCTKCGHRGAIVTQVEDLDGEDAVKPRFFPPAYAKWIGEQALRAMEISA